MVFREAEAYNGDVGQVCGMQAQTRLLTDCCAEAVWWAVSWLSSHALRIGEGLALQDLKLEIEGNLGEPVEVRSSGLVVNVDKPWLSATPDGMLSTSDNTFLVEIKCPYTARDLTIAEAVAQLKSFCLEERDGVFKLKRNHTYFYQVQAQMYVSNIVTYIFVVWTQREMF